MRKLIRRTFRLAVLGTVAFAVVHRKAISANITGKQMPEPPAWHRRFHPGVK